MRNILSIILLTSLSTLANAQDYDNGAKLHADNCVRCHDDSVYTRDNRRVQSLKGLSSQVNLCKNNIGIQWFDDEVGDVIHFLNKKYYHF